MCGAQCVGETCCVGVVGGRDEHAHRAARNVGQQ